MILIIIAVGFITTKMGRFSAKARADLTDVVIYIILPCNIFSSFDSGITTEILKQSGIILLISLGMQLLYMIINRVAYNNIPPDRRVVMKHATMINNATFMGLPVIESVFGHTGVLYGAVILIPMRIFMWTSGLSLYTKVDKKSSFKTIITHPCIWAVFLGFAYALAPFQLPSFISGAISAFGRSITALTMFLVGTILGEVDIKTVLAKDSFYHAFFRLIAIPAIIFGVLTLIGVDPLVRGVAVLSSAMPTATTTVILAEKYKQDVTFASKTLFITTILSMITLPVIAELLTNVFK